MPNVFNLINELPRNLSRGPRKGSWRTGVVFHYNGPPVALHDNPHANNEHWFQHWEGIAKFHLGKNWGTAKSPVYGNGVMYHWAFLPDGTRLRLWPEEDERWHCGNAIWNRTALAFAFALGGNQQPTEAQWESAVDLADEKIKEYGMKDRSIVKGHKEVGSSACPGPHIMRRLNLWRTSKTVNDLMHYVVSEPWGALVRQGPGTEFPVALDGKAKLPHGYKLDVDEVKGEWLHIANNLGFVHKSVLEQV